MRTNKYYVTAHSLDLIGATNIHVFCYNYSGITNETNPNDIVNAIRQAAKTLIEGATGKVYPDSKINITNLSLLDSFTE